MELRYPIVSQIELGSGFNLSLSSGPGSESEEADTAAGRWRLVGETQDTATEMIMEYSGSRALIRVPEDSQYSSCVGEGGTATP